MEESSQPGSIKSPYKPFKSIPNPSNTPSTIAARLHQIILLQSQSSVFSVQVANCRRATDLLIAHKVDYILIDGEDPNSTSRRDELFSISGVRG